MDTASESQPLLRGGDNAAHKLSWLRLPGEVPSVQTSRQRTQKLLNSKEFSTGAQEQMDTIAERIEDLEEEKKQLQKELAHARSEAERR
ncbi:MAG: hypothetical protein LQ340_003492 [Diploschistes diacapsis]|nr:MAG: hypothetical protein LQ340_003492 [Diploschistes diacapsis]